MLAMSLGMAVGQVGSRTHTHTHSKYTAGTRWYGPVWPTWRCMADTMGQSTSVKWYQGDACDPQDVDSKRSLPTSSRSLPSSHWAWRRALPDGSHPARRAGGAPSTLRNISAPPNKNTNTSTHLGAAKTVSVEPMLSLLPSIGSVRARARDDLKVLKSFSSQLARTARLASQKSKKANPQNDPVEDPTSHQGRSVTRRHSGDDRPGMDDRFWAAGLDPSPSTTITQSEPLLNPLPGHGALARGAATRSRHGARHGPRSARRSAGVAGREDRGLSATQKGRADAGVVHLWSAGVTHRPSLPTPAAPSSAATASQPPALEVIYYIYIYILIK